MTKKQTKKPSESKRAAAVSGRTKPAAAAAPAATKKAEAAAPAADKQALVKGKPVKGRDKTGRLTKAALDQIYDILRAKLEAIQKNVDEEVYLARDRDLSLLLDESDIAADAADGDLALRIAEAGSMAVAEIQDCLAKIEEGTYGLCEVCQKPIEHDRLLFMPSATLCIEHARERELQRKASDRNVMWGTLDEEGGEA
ncbi:MAG TPA: TraR/DksA C4-type zinc finger protein [Planctomycetota bacterium]|nr:TraR/DksA C4-type zinc finger protein [Planctomycetota bacterium]